MQPRLPFLLAAAAPILGWHLLAKLVQVQRVQVHLLLAAQLVVVDRLSFFTIKRQDRYARAVAAPRGI